MKTKFLLIVFLLFMLTSCRHENKVITETYADGSPKRESTYKGTGSNKILLHETTYYPHRRIQMDGDYHNDKRHGKWTYYYENGKIWSEGFFKDGKSDGKRTAYFENGKVRYEGFFKDDQRVGVWRFYDENGRLVKENDYSAPPKK